MNTFTKFGATPFIVLDGSAGSQINFIIPSPRGGGIVHITTILVTALQKIGTFATVALIPVYALIASGESVTPILPAGNDSVGMPNAKDVANGSLEWKFAAYANAKSCTPFRFAPGELTITNGQQLIVTTVGLVDASTNAPNVIGGPTSVTVLGYDASSSVQLRAR